MNTLIRWGQHGLVATLAAVIAACDAALASWRRLNEPTFEEPDMNAVPRLMRLLLIAALGAGLTGCGGGSSSDAVPATALRLDSAAAVTQTIGPAGGMLTTTAADGTAYTLTVPPRALRSATAITLAPIASIADLPAGVSLAGGAHLTPEGQRFDVPLKLSIALAAAPASAPLPFTYAGELQQRHLYPASVSGKTIEFEIVHFSGYAALVGALDGALGYFPPPSERGDQGLQELVEAGILGLDAPAARDAAMRNALQGWLDEFIKPEVEALRALSSYELDAFMSGRVARLANELKTFAVALKFALLQGSTADAFFGVQLEFRFEAALAARDAIDLSTAGCSTSPDHAVLLIAPDILAWQQLAQLTDAVVDDDSLLRPAVLQALCVKPVYDPQDGVGFSADVQPGQTGLLTVRAGYSINAGPPRFDLPMLIATAGTTNVSPSGLNTFEIGAGQTHAQQFQWHPQTAEMRIDVSACFAEAGLAEVCTLAAVVRELAALEVYFSDFSGIAGPQWSHSTITTSPGGQRYLGDFQRQTVSLSLADLPAHEQVRIEFDFYTVSDWEGSATPSAGGPDTVVFRVGDQVLLWTSFSTKPGFAQAYPGSYPASSNPPMTGATATASLGYPGGSGHTGDATYRVSLTVPHTASSFAFSVIGSVDAPEATGERWGLDNVRVTVLP